MTDRRTLHGDRNGVELESEGLPAPAAPRAGLPPALAKLLRRLRHDFATPLSGAMLHLEIVGRRLEQAGGGSPEATLQSVVSAREALDKASKLIGPLDRMIAIAEERPESLDLREALACVLAEGPARAEAGGPAVDPGDPARIFGGRRATERALEGFLALPNESASATELVRWQISETESEVILRGSWPGNLEESVRAATPTTRLAEWALEVDGGRLELGQQGDEVVATAHFRRGRP